MKMLLVIVVTSILIITVGYSKSTNNKTENIATNQTDSVTFHLSGQTYSYGPMLDSTTCHAYGDCVCCTGKYLFLNEKDFLTIIKICEPWGDSYSKGTFQIENGNIILHYDSLGVNDENTSLAGNDTSSTLNPKYVLRQTKTPAYTTKLIYVGWNNNTAFKTTDEEAFFVTLDKDYRMSDLINRLKADSVWDKLEMQNIILK